MTGVQTCALPILKEKCIRDTLCRGKLLRRKSFKSLFWILLAIGAATSCAILFEKICISMLFQFFKKNIHPILSILFFSFGTLGRIGWMGQSIGGHTVYEKVDNIILWVSYFLGTFFGVIALMY